MTSQKPTPERPDRKSSKPRFTRGPVVDNIEMVVMAVVLALIVRCFLIEAFQIPTGSMAPTLYGQHFLFRCDNCSFHYAVNDGLGGPVYCSNCGYPHRGHPGAVRGGDRLLVNKVIYRFQKPRRWSPFVFTNPHIIREPQPKTTYIKRLVGMPGDELEVILGDVVVGGQVLRKPASAQSQLWMLVYDSHWPWRLKDKPTWLFDAPETWKEDAGRLSVSARSLSSDTFADFAGHQGDRIIRDHYGYDRGPGDNVVTDVRVRFSLRASGDGELQVVLPWDGSSLRCLLPADGSAGRVLLDERDLENQFGDSDIPALPTGSPVELEFSNLDYLVTLSMNGREVFRHDLWSQATYQRLCAAGRQGSIAEHSRSGVRIGVRGLDVDFLRTRIDRDIYYSARPDMWASIPRPFTEPVVLHQNYLGPIHLTDDQYLAMGDNSPLSYDSRYWGPVPEENLIGKALVVWWHPMRIRLIQ